MKNGKYANSNGAKTGLNKTITLALVLVLVLGCAVGGTIAWFTDKTDDVINTFTVGNIDITLEETWNTDADKDGTNDSWSAALIPGFTYAKDPKVTVEAGSEDCWLFVKFEENNNPTKYLDYTSTLTDTNGWTQGNSTNGIPGNVWFRKVMKTDTTRSWELLEDNLVTINSERVTKESMPTAASTPELVYTAYAVQLYKTNGVEFTEAEAWDQVSTN